MPSRKIQKPSSGLINSAVWRPIKELKPYAHNPRNHTQEQVAQIANSIKEFGWTYPILVDENDEIIAGHGRLMAAKKLRLKEVPVISADGWTEEQKRAYRIFDNRLTEAAGWDEDFLAAELDGLDAAGFDVQPFIGDWPESYDDDDDAPQEGESENRSGNLIADFGEPPFSVFDTTSGRWQRRKAAWIALGIKSEEGRDGKLIYNMDSFQKYKGGKKSSIAGTSVFDPVLTELMVTWFSPEGAHVLDPFAGGSVRGVVSGMLGRSYTGIELRPEQVASNREQAEAIFQAHKGVRPVIVPDALTPVEDHDGIFVKRDDAFTYAGVRGGKVRSAISIIDRLKGEGAQTVITASSRSSPQAVIVAAVARHSGLACRIHMPEGEVTPEMNMAMGMGAEIIQHPAGYNSVIIARAKEDAQQDGCGYVPFGMEIDDAVTHTARQVQNIPEGVKRIVMPVGSGMSLAGVLAGLRQAGRDIPVIGVMVGSDPAKRLDKYAPEGWRDMVTLVEAEADYHSEVMAELPSGERLDSHYEAKAWGHAEKGDLFWCVGVRPSEATAHASMPKWIEGDSNAVLDTLGGEYDFLLTCPPYGDLEVYSDDQADISNMPADQFRAVYASILKKAVAKLADNSFACVVVGDYRGKDGNFTSFPAFTIQCMEAAGAKFYNDAVLINMVGTLPIRARLMFSAARKLGRRHQNVLIFCKGDPKAASDKCGPPGMIDLAYEEQPAATDEGGDE